MAYFKTWRDFKLFYKTYATCSCMNCKYGDSEKDSGLFVCMKTLSPVRLNLIHVCAEWEDDDGHTMKDFLDRRELKLSNETIEKLNEITERLTFEEIEEIINECERDD